MSTRPETDKEDKEVCPECGEPIIYQGGCWVCQSCGTAGCG